MTDAAWRSYASAPPPGALVCESEAVAAGSALCVTVSSDAGAFPILLVRGKDGLRAFVNACPHHYLPLDYRGGRIVSADGRRLLCTAHGAVFDAATGACLSGALDAGLNPVPVMEVDGHVRIAG